MKKAHLLLATGIATAIVTLSTSALANSGQHVYYSSDPQYGNTDTDPNRARTYPANYQPRAEGYIGRDGGYYSYTNRTNESGPSMRGMNNGNENFSGGHISISGSQQ